MRTTKTLTAATLAALMASTSVASAGNLGNGDVFAADTSNTVVNMTADEMKATQGEFACGGMCVIGLVSAGAGILSAGLLLGDQAHQKWG
jgi:hypothetical protein